MQRPKQQALAFLLGALLVGGVVGFSADRVFRKADASSDDKRKAFFDDLALRPEQRASMDSLLDARNCQLEAVFKQMQPALDSIKAATRSQINALLTPDQLARLDARRKEVEGRHEQDRKRLKSHCK